MTPLVASVVCGLVGYRAWRLVAVDDLADGLRRRVLDDRPHLDAFVMCHWCAGFWLTGAVVLVAAATVGVEAPWLVWPAAAVVAAGLAEVMD